MELRKKNIFTDSSRYEALKDWLYDMRTLMPSEIRVAIESEVDLFVSTPQTDPSQNVDWPAQNADGSAQSFEEVAGLTENSDIQRDGVYPRDIVIPWSVEKARIVQVKNAQMNILSQNPRRNTCNFNNEER